MTPDAETNSMGVAVELRPLVIVAHEVHDAGGMERVMAETIRRAVTTRPVIVVSIGLSGSLQHLVAWHRIRAPRRPAIVTFLLFYLFAGIRLRSLRDCLIHIQGPIVPNRADVATVHFCHAAFRKSRRSHAVTGGGIRDLNRRAFQTIATVAERWSYRPSRVRRLACVSRGVAEEVQTHFPKMSISVVSNGVSLLEFHADEAVRHSIRMEAGLPDDTVVALFVGGDWERKGLATVFDGLAMIDRDLLLALELWVIGRGDSRKYARRAQELGVGRAVRFLGEHPTVAPFYAASDIFVLPSSYETFGLAAYEAAASRLPLLVNQVHGIREILVEGVTGFDIGGSAATLADRLAELSADPMMRQQMGMAAERIVRSFSWDRSWDALTQVYARADHVS